MQNNIISGIYCIENKVNNKKYIGQSKNINDRWYKHKNELNMVHIAMIIFNILGTNMEKTILSFTFWNIVILIN